MTKSEGKRKKPNTGVPAPVSTTKRQRTAKDSNGKGKSNGRQPPTLTGSDTLIDDNANVISSATNVASAAHSIAVASGDRHASHIHALDAFVRVFQQNPHMELEGRLGRYDSVERRFVSGVSMEHFSRIQTAFANADANVCWSSAIPAAQTVDYFFRDNVRHSTTGKVYGNSTMRKRVVATLTLVCEQREWDVRFRLCEELPLDDYPADEAYHMVRVKHRNSYVTAAGDAQYDMTIVQSGKIKEAACRNSASKTCEVEVELLHHQSGGAETTSPTTSAASPRESAKNIFIKTVQLLGIFDAGDALTPLTFVQAQNTMASR